MINLKNLSRYIAGFVFIFSGLVKGIDPMGSMYKFVDYFTAFHIEALDPLAYVLGVILCASESIIGFAILTGIRMRIAAWGLLLFMIGFTPLTLYLALENPVADCGCFGDAVHLTNWQTFYKNIIISVFVIIVFINRKKYNKLSEPPGEWVAIFIMTAIFVLFIQYNYRHLPVVDFRPYKTGTNIPEKMIIPEGAPVDEYETTLIYEKDSVQQDFTLENYPSDDTTWFFIDSKTKLIKEGYKPPIYDFNLITPEGQDLTDVILSDPGYSLFMLSIKISEADQELIKKAIETGLDCQDEGIGFYILTSSSPEMLIDYSPDLNILFVDETTMKTIIRSNPGFMAISEGTIIKKWAGRDMPDKEKLIEIFINSSSSNKNNGKIILISVLASILLLSYITNLILRKLKKSIKIL
ncbi:MAG TPA: DoxX family protein [Bacteroidales bacterium]|nr:DoxX family protein [Bacteroidales bacterium]